MQSYYLTAYRSEVRKGSADFFCSRHKRPKSKCWPAWALICEFGGRIHFTFIMTEWGPCFIVARFILITQKGWSWNLCDFPSARSLLSAFLILLYSAFADPYDDTWSRLINQILSLLWNSQYGQAIIISSAKSFHQYSCLYPAMGIMRGHRIMPTTEYALQIQGDLELEAVDAFWRAICLEECL